MIETDAKVYDTSTAELVLAGWRKRGAGEIPAAYFEQDTPEGFIHFIVELGNPKYHRDPTLILDDSRITLVPQDQKWSPANDDPDITTQLKKAFRQIAGAAN